MPPPSPMYNPLDPWESPFYYESQRSHAHTQTRLTNHPVRANHSTLSTGPSARIRAIARYVRGAIEDGTVDPTSAFGIIQSVATAGASWEIVESVLDLLAKGADGIAGTQDDVIPETTMIVLRIMLRHRVVRDLAAWATAMFQKDRCNPPTTAQQQPDQSTDQSVNHQSPDLSLSQLPDPSPDLVPVTATTRKRWFCCVTRLPKLCM